MRISKEAKESVENLLNDIFPTDNKREPVIDDFVVEGHKVQLVEVMSRDGKVCVGKVFLINLGELSRKELGSLSVFFLETLKGEFEI